MESTIDIYVGGEDAARSLPLPPVATASELFPPFNAYLQLVPLPDAEFRNTILALLAVNIVVTVVWDRLMSFIFARHIFRASVEDWSMEDVAKLFKLVAIVCGVICASILPPDACS